MSLPDVITSPQDESLRQLCRILTERADQVDVEGQWPGDQLRDCAEFGVYRWFVPPEYGGFGWHEVDLMRGYLQLSAACLTTAFILTQATGAIRRIAATASSQLKQQLLPELLSGSAFATLGISHLTTSRRHLARPALRAKETADGFRLDGYSAWVTGGAEADWVVIGAQLDDQRQILAALPMNLEGISTDEPERLVGLSASRTGAVRLNNVALLRRWVLAGPVENVMQGASGAKTGGLQTSALAIGLAGRVIDYLREQCEQRTELSRATEGFAAERDQLESNLLANAQGREAPGGEHLRTRANSLVLRAAQAGLAAAKGTGYVSGHPAGRWCREALFFLVWSCPQPVMAANLCQLAGIRD